ncbi:MAG: acyltransferase [Prevotella sp.]|nr:acyltransferase [Prevotella sp.]MBQ4633282.1 acyltransferase [Prevotella sp.]MBQ8629840.1 acyltransferase [Prevotella sp.]MEE1091761.1 acyltransferase [Prevotella sp.]
MKIQIKETSFSALSTYRSELMGLAMLFVILFHVWLPKTDPMFGLHRIGNVGVDMFMFLSGIGLWYAWQKKPTLKQFYWRRYIRIYPAWLIMACLFYIPNYLNVEGGGYSPNIWHLIANILFNWSFWRIDDLTFWFIPSIMMMYTFAPAYMSLIQRSPAYRWMPVLFMVLAVMVQYYPPVHAGVGHIEIFFSRIPIFLLGVNCGEWVRERRTLEPSAMWLLLLVFVMSLLMCVEFEESWRGRFPLFLERMVYIPLTVSGLLLLAHLLDVLPQWANKAFAFVGTISLEIYLIHAHFVLKYLGPYKLGFWLTTILLLLITIPLSWLLHKLVGYIISFFPKDIR